MIFRKIKKIFCFYRCGELLLKSFLPISLGGADRLGSWDNDGDEENTDGSSLGPSGELLLRPLL